MIFYNFLQLFSGAPAEPGKNESAKRGHGGRGVWGEFRRARAFRRSEAEAVSRPDSFGKKFGFHSGDTAK